MRSQTNLIVIIAAIALVGIVGIAWAMMQKPASDTVIQENTVMEPSTQVEPDIPADGSTEVMDSETGVRTIAVEAGSFYYQPNVIRVKQGETVKIVLTAADMMHDFNIEELGVKLPITKSGEANEVEFTATQVGEFEYYCSVGEHRKNGQVGTLIVEE